jgi:hypothetical protein
MMANTAFETEHFSLAAYMSDLAMPFPVPAHITRPALFCVLVNIILPAGISPIGIFIASSQSVR